jgi:DNA-binding LacI/PurR family transcriptional regulator
MKRRKQMRKAGKHSLNKNSLDKSGAITLKLVADYVGLTSGTVSLVLNRAPQASSIPQPTQDRIFAAARKLDYRPNLFARALRVGPGLQANSTDDDPGKATGALMFVGTENFLRAIHAIQQAGMRVPGDCSVVGMDQLPQALSRP